VAYYPQTGLAVRGIGLGATGLGLTTIATSLVLTIEPAGWLSVALLAPLGLVGLLSVTVLTVGILRAFGRGPRLVLGTDGFINATGYGLGPRRGAWKDVRKVQADGPFVSVDLVGGQQTLIRASVIDVEPKLLAQELRTRLNKDRGYRPLSQPDANSEPN
jgi:hypothetical protein